MLESGGYGHVRRSMMRYRATVICRTSQSGRANTPELLHRVGPARPRKWTRRCPASTMPENAVHEVPGGRRSLCLYRRKSEAQSEVSSL
jgi:hypothetical protein